MSTWCDDPPEDAGADPHAVWDDDPEYLPNLDPIDLVRDASVMMAVFAAHRFERVEQLHRDALTEVATYRGASLEIIERSLRLELAAALQMTEHGAGRLIATAEGLVRRYPQMLDSLHRAHTTERHAEIFVELVDTVEQELRDQVVPLAVQLAETHAVGTFRRRLRTLVDSVRAATLEERHLDALVARRVVIEPGEDGMSWLLVHLPAVEARAVYDRATALAGVLRDVHGEERTLDQLRADVVADLLIEGEVGAHPERARGVQATVSVTVPALALLDDALAARSEPAMVDGVGPIPISRARELCANADGWMRVLTHPETGMVLSVGRVQYRPPPALRRLVRWRAARCLAPGCGVPAGRCDIDHQVAWAQGGRTELANLDPLCAGHHTVKHHGGWIVRQVEGSGGAVEWISPLGRRYVVEPERPVPVFRSAA